MLFPPLVHNVYSQRIEGRQALKVLWCSRSTKVPRRGLLITNSVASRLRRASRAGAWLVPNSCDPELNEALAGLVGPAEDAAQKCFFQTLA